MPDSPRGNGRNIAKVGEALYGCMLFCLLQAGATLDPIAGMEKWAGEEVPEEEAAIGGRRMNRIMGYRGCF